MLQASVDPGDLETWAGFLLDHSLGGITPEDRVMIKGERICWPLMAVLERRIIQAGAAPDVLLVAPNNERGRVWSGAMARWGNAKQIECIPEWHGLRYQGMTKYIEVMGAEDPREYCELNGAQVGALARAERPYMDIRCSKRWVLTVYPTAAAAAMEGMDLDAYTRVIVQASTSDPRPLKAAQERLLPSVREAKRITIETRHPRGRRDLQLTMSIEQRLPLMCYGQFNFPGGEIYSSPDARSAQGEIYLDLPIHYGGHEIRGICLELEGGRISKYSAEIGQDYLAAIIETDDGSHRLGEVALGMNPGLERVLKNPLFVEKVGGTVHIAIGDGIEECFVEEPFTDEGRQRIALFEHSGALNRSAQHVDIVADFRRGGCGHRVLLDEKALSVEGGVWVAR